MEEDCFFETELSRKPSLMFNDLPYVQKREVNQGGSIEEI